MLILSGCQDKKVIKKENFIGKPFMEWPTIALTNEIAFVDTLYSNIGNVFLIDTGEDTLGITCKHIFFIFTEIPGLKTIDTGPTFIHWRFYPKNTQDPVIETEKMRNQNMQENIGQFNNIKDRDWLVFDIKTPVPDIYPLKIRYKPLKKGEIVYTFGWGYHQHDLSHPEINKLQCYKSMGDYYYMQSLSHNGSPEGKSGSPVIDKNGYLVGIVSGAEGNLTVIGSVSYLEKILANH